MRTRYFGSVLSACVIVLLCYTFSLADDEFRKLNNEGFEHLRRGEYDRAIHSFDEALRLNPDYAIAYGNRGIAYFILGRFSDAVSDFEHCRKLLPHSDIALKIYLSQARIGKSDLQILNDVTDLDPASVRANAIAEYFRGRKTRDAVLEDINHRKLPDRKTTLCYIYFYLAEGALLQGNRPEAMQLLQRSVDTGVKDIPEFVWARGELQNLQTSQVAHAEFPQSGTPKPQNDAKSTTVDAQKTETEADSKSPTNATAVTERVPVVNDYGSIDGQVYKNPTVGIELTVPEELTFRPLGSNRPAGTEKMLLIISADSKPHNRLSVRKYIVDEEVKLILDPLARHAVSERSLDGYLRYASESVIDTGFKRTDGPTTAAIGEVRFLRGNFIRGKRRHTLLVTIHNGYGIAFVIASNDAETTEKLIQSAVFKLTP